MATVADVSDSLDATIPDSAHEFFRDVNRGGLWKPTPELFSVGCLCWRVFAELSTKSLLQNFLNTPNQRDLFKEIITISFYESFVTSSWSVAIMCDAGNNILEGISIRFFNTMCKNLLMQINMSKPPITARKIRKLTGRNALN